MGTHKHKHKKKVVAKAHKAASTDGIPGSLIKCEVKLEKGEWVQPDSCKTYYIDDDANFPDVSFEIQTDEPPPYAWSWEIKWIVQACPQAKNKKRFKPKTAKTYSEKGAFTSESKLWKTNLKDQSIGGELTVTVQAGTTTFVRKAFILGKGPSEEKVHAYLDTFTEKKDAALAKKIFKQESHNKHFYTDEMPLVSFDNGYGLGQSTNPVPTYEQVWNWKKHVDYIVKSVIASKRAAAKKYLSKHGEYTDQQSDLETLVYYNGANYHYYVWDEAEKKWAVNTQVLCDPNESNKGWDGNKSENKDKTLEQLKKGEGGKPIYTGRCYAEHVKNSNEP